MAFFVFSCTCKKYIQQEVENKMNAQKEHIAELGQSFIAALLGITEKM